MLHNIKYVPVTRHATPLDQVVQPGWYQVYEFQQPSDMPEAPPGRRHHRGDLLFIADDIITNLSSCFTTQRRDLYFDAQLQLVPVTETTITITVSQLRRVVAGEHDQKLVIEAVPPVQRL